METPPKKKARICEHHAFSVLQLCSGHLLTEPYPNNWLEMGEKKQDEFIRTHAWGPVDHLTEYDIINAIAAMKDATINWLENNLPRDL